MSDGDNAVHVSSGVEALIQRLRDEGVENGRAQAEKIVADAEARAGWILKQAEEDVQRIRKQATEEADRLLSEGCELGQGFLYSKPVTGDLILDLLRGEGRLLPGRTAAGTGARSGIRLIQGRSTAD